MTIRLRTILYATLFVCATSIFGQTDITCDLVEISKLTFDKSPIIQRNSLQIDNANGGFQQQRGVFDYQFSSGLSYYTNRLNLFELDTRNAAVEQGFVRANNAGFSVGLQKRFRTGLSANVNVDYAQLSDNLFINRFGQNVGDFVADHTISSTFSLTQPLLRGRGKRIATATENASSLQVESAESNFEFTSSFELLQVGIAYWQYLTAYRNLEIFTQNENRVSNVLKITEELVKADKKPAGDLVQIKADLANQERQTKVAEQNLYNTRLNLGRSIGLNETESKRLGLPESEFPVIGISGFDDQIDAKTMIKLANENRKDLTASQKTQEALKLQLDLTNNNRKPQLDLTGFVSYAGENMGNGLDPALSAISNKEGRNYTIGARLNLTFPFSNNVARGAYVQNKAAFTDQEIAYNDLQRNIDLNVNIALNNLKNSVLVLKKAQETLEYYQEVFKNEQLKFQNGLTTLLNLILFQERLTFAQLDYLQAQQLFAVSIINLRYETGTLISVEDNKIIASAITKDLFYTIPNFKN